MHFDENTVRLATSQDGPSWNEFVEGQPTGSVCHRFEWRRVVELAYRKRCYYLIAKSGGDWTGVLPLVHMASPLAGNRLVSLPFLDQGGTLAESPEDAATLLRSALGLAKRLGARGIDLRGGTDAGVSGEPHRFRLLLPLTESAELLWKTIGGKVRNQIRKAEKSGLKTRRVDPGDLSRFHAVFARNMRDLGSPVHSIRFFVEIFSAFGDSANLFLTFRGEAPVAGGVALRFRDTVTVPWASSLHSARRDCPNHSLYWAILQDAVSWGARTFDFGRSAPGSGTFHFKKQWGAEAIPLVWSSHDSAGELRETRQLDPRRHAPLASLWRRLPLSLANRIGPTIRRHLAN